MATVFKKFSHEERAFINPEDVTKRNPDFPELCVSTFSENIINKFTSLKSVKVIGELYTANGTIPIYEILYKNTRIAFFLSRVGAPACVAGIEEVSLIWQLRNIKRRSSEWKNHSPHSSFP